MVFSGNPFLTEANVFVYTYIYTNACTSVHICERTHIMCVCAFVCVGVCVAMYTSVYVLVKLREVCVK